MWWWSHHGRFVICVAGSFLGALCGLGWELILSASSGAPSEFHVVLAGLDSYNAVLLAIVLGSVHSGKLRGLTCGPDRTHVCNVVTPVAISVLISVPIGRMWTFFFPLPSMTWIFCIIATVWERIYMENACDQRCKDSLRYRTKRRTPISTAGSSVSPSKISPPSKIAPPSKISPPSKMEPADD